MITDLNVSCVYGIVNNENNKLYIGSALNFKKRIKEHTHNLIKKKHHSQYLQKAYTKYGGDKFTFEIIETVKDRTKLIEREQHWMDFFKPEYNICKIAGSRLGIKSSTITKEKLRIATTANWKNESIRKRFMKNKNYSWASSPDIIEIRRKARLGLKLSEETKQKISKAHKGKPLTEEHKKALRKPKRPNLIVHNARKVMSINTKTNETLYHDSIKAAATITKSHRSAISQNLKGKIKIVNKLYTFKYT